MRRYFSRWMMLLTLSGGLSGAALLVPAAAQATPAAPVITRGQPAKSQPANRLAKPSPTSPKALAAQSVQRKPAAAVRKPAVAVRKPQAPTRAGALSIAPGTFAPGRGLSARDLTLAKAMDRAERSDWRGAQALLAQAKADRDMYKIALWLYILSGDGNMDPRVPAKFQRENPTWPSAKVTQRRAEDNFVDDGDDKAVIDWFAAYPPTTGNGAVRLATALYNKGQDKLGRQWLQWGWITGSFTAEREGKILARHKSRLTAEDHIRRLDSLVWADAVDGALRMAPRVPADIMALARARMALRHDAGNVDTLVNQVPQRLKRDTGLIYERARWRRAKGLDDDARELLLSVHGDPSRPDLWWAERHYHARELLKFSDYKAAYRMAASHGCTEGVPFSEAEFLAGWIALRFLKDPRTALQHFTRLHDGVSFPISKSRGAYWAGRAAAAMKDKVAASKWYLRAAAYGPYFYGQLAKSQLSAHAGPPIQPMPKITRQDQQQFDRHELTRAARLLARLGDEEKARVILVAMTEAAAKNAKQQAMIGRLAREIGGYDMAVRVAKASSQQGVELIEIGYPVDYVGKFKLPIENALALAIARQESEFNTAAVSPVGARGLMQLMPATAKQQAAKARLPYVPAKLNDPYFNLRLGGQFLGHLIDVFDGSYVMAIAAYNAGPGRISAWNSVYGDPRQGEIDIVDWMELIPYGETRNYVQRVLEAVEIYRYRLSGKNSGRNLDQDLVRGVAVRASL